MTPSEIKETAGIIGFPVLFKARDIKHGTHGESRTPVPPVPLFIGYGEVREVFRVGCPGLRTAPLGPDRTFSTGRP
jgi:hypothetical protein